MYTVWLANVAVKMYELICSIEFCRMWNLQRSFWKSCCVKFLLGNFECQNTLKKRFGVHYIVYVVYLGNSCHKEAGQFERPKHVG